MQSAAKALVLALGIVAAGSGCRKSDPTKLVVGVQGDPLPDSVSALHVVVKVEGKVVTDETVRPPRGSSSAAPFPQPWETTVPGGGLGAAKVEVQVDALGDPAASAPLLTRLASTQLVPGHTALLRVPLESRCMVYPPPPPGSKVPGPLSGPACVAPGTCITGICRPSFVSPAALETYAPGWPTNAPDRCKPHNGGPPILQAGTGQSYYLPLASGQTLQAEAGPQGGHHIWIATRMKNLKQAGTVTQIEGIQPGTGAKVPPATLAFTYSPDEGGFCKLYGIRYQLDTGGVDYTQFLGKPLDLNVTVTDPSGATATATAHIQIAATLLGP